MSNNKRQITGLILAGGAGRRVGGSDKGLLSYRGRPLIAQVVQRLGPQVGALMIWCTIDAPSTRVPWRAWKLR
jgi:molybdopterin-guanine dinucleotide biosynthesis protein A